VTANKLWSPERRDIIWIDCNPQAGKEMKDLHPMVVLSPRTFNERTNIVIGLPMTAAQSNDDNPFAVKIAGPRGVVSYALCHQPKSFEWRVRGGKPHPWKQVPENVFRAVCEQLNQIIAIGD
jgi:mRNA interferase MazF